MEPPSTPGPSVLIVDCPDARYIPALQQAPAVSALAAECQKQGLQQQQQQQQQQGIATASSAVGSAGPAVGRPPPGGRLTVIVHLGVADVVASPAYQQWMGSFGGGCTHLVVSADSQRATTVRSFAQLQAQLNLLEPAAFQLGAFAEQPAQQQMVQHNAAGAPVVAAPNMCKVVLCPARHQGVDLSEVPEPLDVAAHQAAMGDAHPEGMQQALQAFQDVRRQLQAGDKQEAGEQAGQGQQGAEAVTPPALVGISR